MPSLILFADAQAASETLKSSISPLFSTMITIAAVLCILFVVFGGYYYMTSSGNPEKLERAKKTLRNAFIGVVVVLGAGALVAVMQNAYSSKPVSPVQIVTQQPKGEESVGIGDVVNEAIKGFMKVTIESIGKPIVYALKQFTTATPLMAQNGSVFNLWMVIVAIADVLFLLVIGLIGFRIMSSSVVGFEDVDIRSLIPQIILVFIIANVSIFAIDAIISVSNAMIQALLIGMSNDIIWAALGGLIATAASANIGILILIVIAVIFAVMLLVYYLKRIIVLYIGAVLSPLIALLWLLPSFRDFAVSSAKMYITTIFALFVQVVVLMLAVSLFSGLVKGDGDPMMTALLVIATLSVLLSTNRTMNHLTMVSVGGHGMRKLGNTFVRGVSHVASSVKQSSARPTVSVSRTLSPAAAGARPAIPASYAFVPSETRRTPTQKAAAELTHKQTTPRKVSRSGSARKPSITVTRTPARKTPRIPKGGK
ncbi:MAG TPA: pilin [Candidatus Saccharimonadales bacterium]|nr:pilin [Candidatus Saccharimonadales bacterium]